MKRIILLSRIIIIISFISGQWDNIRQQRISFAKPLRFMQNTPNNGFTSRNNINNGFHLELDV